jgi:hypothetical protein
LIAADVRFGSKADIGACLCHVRYSSERRHRNSAVKFRYVPKQTYAVQQIPSYSITSSARSSSDVGTSMPIDLASD